MTSTYEYMNVCHARQYSKVNYLWRDVRTGEQYIAGNAPVVEIVLDNSHQYMLSKPAKSIAKSRIEHTTCNQLHEPQLITWTDWLRGKTFYQGAEWRLRE